MTFDEMRKHVEYVSKTLQAPTEELTHDEQDEAEVQMMASIVTVAGMMLVQVAQELNEIKHELVRLNNTVEGR